MRLQSPPFVLGFGGIGSYKKRRKEETGVGASSESLTAKVGKKTRNQESEKKGREIGGRSKKRKIQQRKGNREREEGIRNRGLRAGVWGWSWRPKSDIEERHNSVRGTGAEVGKARKMRAWEESNKGVSRISSSNIGWGGDAAVAGAVFLLPPLRLSPRVRV